METGESRRPTDFGLNRFHEAQEHSYSAALKEIRAGQKRSHWIWYIFPQLAGLGHSPTARYYAIRSLDEARAYLADPLLGSRLLEISEALLELDCGDPRAVMGYPDDLKLCSSMTLFREAGPEEGIFQKVLDKYYGGRADQRTLELLGGEGGGRNRA